jgi:ubiquinone/menaquinone biosynthesis C-methylase UbiE
MNPVIRAEADRIRAEYERRERDIPSNRYSLNQSVNYFFHTQLCRQMLRQLTAAGWFPLRGRTVLDVGCGSGAWLLNFVQWGAAAASVAGIDLSETRISEARSKLPMSDVRCGDASTLPWADASFDLVTQFVLFTSILDDNVQAAIADEMMRVLKPGGLMLWYDFRVDNPSNRAVRGVRAARVRSLFPRCDTVLRSVTLAPPIARRLVPVSWAAAVAAESLPFLRTHYLGLIRKRS